MLSISFLEKNVIKKGKEIALCIYIVNAL
jgi:hypothetical protein